MKLDKPSNNTFTVHGVILYFTVIILGLVAYLTPIGEIIWGYLNDVGLVDIGDHISNYLLSLIILFAAGSIALLNNISKKRILLIALLLLSANFITELFVTLKNTPDIIDALYGTVGVLIALILIFVMDKYGIRKNKIK